VSPALANFLFEAANFLLLAAVLGWVLFKPVRRVLDEERAHHDKEEADQKRLRAEAESLASAARAAREAVDRETGARRADILAAARKEASRILEEARKREDAERRAFDQERRASQSAAAAALAEAVGRIAGESVARLLADLDGPSLDDALVHAACEKLRAMPGAALRSAFVEAAHPLDSAARSQLEAVLGTGFQERTVGELRAGVRVTTSAGQVDATAAAIARHAARAVALASAEPRGGPDG
jgi:F0F1-type ATP synthase membrane subunit b/b'